MTSGRARPDDHLRGAVERLRRAPSATRPDVAARSPTLHRPRRQCPQEVPDEPDPGRSSCATRNASRTSVGIMSGRDDLARQLGQRLHRRHDVDDLEARLPRRQDPLLAGDHDHGHRAQQRVGGAGREIQRTGPERGDAHAGLAGEPAVGRGHERGGLLMTGQHQFDRGAHGSPRRHRDSPRRERRRFVSTPSFSSAATSSSDPLVINAPRRPDGLGCTRAPHRPGRQFAITRASEHRRHAGAARLRGRGCRISRSRVQNGVGILLIERCIR